MTAPESRRTFDFLMVRGPSQIVLTDSTGSRGFQVTDPARVPDVLDAWDSYLDRFDAANEDADGNLAAA
ncbi:MAG TPA: hypothetical protein VE645_19090 [Pseudonocardiaceae bacterium]|jgi:hypothetical protein|nr:hypothetical protein [Pseudonocardiaceae bacterium]